MNNDKVPVPVGPRGVELHDLDAMFRFAECYIQSGLAPKSFSKPQQLVIAWAKAAELGLTPLQAVEGMSIINGRVGIMGDLALAMVEASGLLEKKKVEYSGSGDDLSCTVTLTRKGREAVAHSFSIREAMQAQIYGSVWKSYPKRMTYYRALGFALRDEFPDIMKGTKTVEELADYPDSDQEKVRKIQERSDEILAHPPAGVRVIETTGAQPTPQEALEPAFPEDDIPLPPPPFAEQLQRDFLHPGYREQQQPLVKTPEAPPTEPKADISAEPPKPQPQPGPPQIQMPLEPPPPAAPDLSWQQHVIRTVDHNKFRNRKVGDLTQRELTILEDQWLSVVEDDWENATPEQQADAQAFRAAIAFSNPQKPY